jgi:hypothetical protein
VIDLGIEIDNVSQLKEVLNGIENYISDFTGRKVEIVDKDKYKIKSDKSLIYAEEIIFPNGSKNKWIYSLVDDIIFRTPIV